MSRSAKSGKTRAMIEALPLQPTMIVVHGTFMLDPIREIIEDIKGPLALKLYYLAVIRDEATLYRHIRQTPNNMQIVIDHGFYERGSISREVKDKLFMFQQRREAAANA